VIGLGTGCTAGSATLHGGIDGVAVIEIERAMIEAAGFFHEENHGVLRSPKTDLRVTDGRHFLRLHPGEFDVIISEPSNPWLAGTSDLFTTEFYERGARALRPGGLFCQWIQLYGLSPENVKLAVRTFLGVFPHSFLASPLPGTDLVLVGGRGKWALDLARAEGRVLASAEIAKDLSRIGIRNIFDLAVRIRLGPSELRAYAGSGPLHTDDHPVILYRSFRDRYRDTGPENMRVLAAASRGVSPYVDAAAGPARERLLRGLADAYVRFLSDGPEHRECLRRLNGR
jgi:spermidine synthase